MNLAAPLMRLKDVSVVYPATVALNNVNLELRAGEIHALMGQNGAGKSTIAKLLRGVTQPDAGVIELRGKEQSFRTPADSLNVGITGVFQDIHLSPALSVGENITLGQEVKSRFRVDWRATRAAARRQLEELGLGDLSLNARLSNLAPSIQQLVALARALVVNPEVLVLDEPTSSLEAADVKRLFGVLRKLKNRGVATVFISHFLEQVYAISDRITVLRDGAKVGEYPTQSIDQAELISLMLGRDFDELQSLDSQRHTHHHEPDAPTIYQAKQIGLSGEVEPTDFGLHRGEIVGFAGLRGSGRTELALLLSGTWRSDSGTLVVSGKKIRLNDPGTALSHRIAMSAEDRVMHGTIADFSVEDNIMLALQAMRGWSRPISKKERKETVQWYLDLLELEPAKANTPVKFLSGGSQQKVLLARWLATKPRVLILDEPTKGIDIGAKLEIQKRVMHLAGEGMAVVFISSELEEVVRICDRIVVLKDRKKIGEMSNGPGVNVDTIVEMIAAPSEDYF